MAVLQGFFDDTESKGDEMHAKGLAGFLFDDEGLRRFTAEWDARFEPRLDAAATPFRSSDCFQRRFQFKPWPREDRVGFLDDLARLIGDTRGPGFYACVDNDSYKQYVRTAPGKEQFIINQFGVCLVSLMIQVAEWAEKIGLPDADQFQYCFERGSVGEGKAAQILKRIEARPEQRSRLRLSGYSFIRKGCAAGLYTADLFAWELQRNIQKDRKYYSPRMKMMIGENRTPLHFHRPDSSTIDFFAFHNAYHRLWRD